MSNQLGAIILDDLDELLEQTYLPLAFRRRGSAFAKGSRVLRSVRAMLIVTASNPLNNESVLKRA